ncbi:MAG: hypothetical protein AMXMBFR84_38970 [Candidatus Hydrogenedentota bacterium]
MALTEFQRNICKLIAGNRIASGESYVAGGTALGEATRSARLSRDIGLFHDRVEAVDASWQADRALLEQHGYETDVIRERAGYVEAVVRVESGEVLMQWTADSAIRFFPLVEHAEFGLVLHPFDLATNKVLALVGRLEARDWVDVIYCHQRIQRLGYLAWAASSKDPAISPVKILEQAGRSARYSKLELDTLDLEGPSPDARVLSEQWHDILEDAVDLVRLLPSEHVGLCVLGEQGELFNGDHTMLESALASGDVRFHSGCLRGAYPNLVDS